MGGFLVAKFVKQTKIDSRLANQRGLYQIALVQTEPNERACGTRVLRKTNAAMRQKHPRLDTAGSVFH
jgi:hypothetical protein